MYHQTPMKATSYNRTINEKKPATHFLIRFSFHFPFLKHSPTLSNNSVTCLLTFLSSISYVVYSVRFIYTPQPDTQLWSAAGIYK